MLETTTIDYAVRVAMELHQEPYGPLGMYASIPLDKRGRHTAAYTDDNLDYSVLYFPDRNISNSGHYEKVSVIKHTDEYTDESKRMLEKAVSLGIGETALGEYAKQKAEYKRITQTNPEAPGLRKRCQQLGLPYMAILFSSAPDAPEIAHTTLYLPAYARAKKALGIFQSSVTLRDVHYYNANADNEARPTFWNKLLPRVVS